MMFDPKIDLWAIDEVYFQQHGSRCRMWIAPEESDPIVLHEPTRKSIGYFGAVRLRDGKFVYRREENKFNAGYNLETIRCFLKWGVACVRSGYDEKSVTYYAENFF